MRNWTLRWSRLGSPQVRAAVFVVAVGMVLNVEPLIDALVEPGPVGHKLASAVATVIFEVAYVQVAWPLVFGGLGQTRHAARVLAYAFGVTVFSAMVGTEWSGIAFIVIALLWACLPVPAAVAGSLTVLAGTVWGGLGFGMSITHVITNAVTTVLLGAVFYMMLWVSTTLRFVEAGREAAEQMVVLEERLRISRDLHDVAVHLFTSIGLKAEIADRAIATDPCAAAEELRQIRQVSDQGLQQVRALAHGYRHTSLSETIAEAARVLDSAGATFEWQLADAELDDRVEQALCWTVRESVTNALRHSSPTSVTIRLIHARDQVRMTIANDGVLPEHSPRRHGNGLTGLGERLAELGGTVTSTRTDKGHFLITATCPVRGPMPGRA